MNENKTIIDEDLFRTLVKNYNYVDKLIKECWFIVEGAYSDKRLKELARQALLKMNIREETIYNFVERAEARRELRKIRRREIKNEKDNYSSMY